MPRFAKISLSACPQDAFRRGRLSALTLVLTVSLTGSPWESLRTTGAQPLGPSPQLVGDLDGNHRVDFKNLRAFAWQWLDPYCLFFPCEANLDGVEGVNMADFALLAKNWQIEEPHVVIGEFMARNSSTLLDKDGHSSDWIEICNQTDTNVSLNGWYLTDNNDNWTKWQFSDGLQIEAGESLIVFASENKYEDYPNNYPYVDPAGYYHTNFNLDKDPGEYLALVAPDGNTIVHEYAPEYPEQLTFNDTSRQFSPDNSSAFGTGIAIQTIFGNDSRVRTKLDGLLNLRLINWLTGAFITTVATTSVKLHRFVNSIWPERPPIDTFVAGLSALTTGFVRFFGSGWLNNITRWRLGRVRGIPGKLSYLVGKFDYLFGKFSVFLDKSFVGFEKFGNLLFKFSNASLIELFSFRCQFLPSNHLLWLLSGERGPPLEK